MTRKNIELIAAIGLFALMLFLLAGINIVDDDYLECIDFCE